MELVNKAGGLAKTFTIRVKVFKDIDSKMFDIFCWLFHSP